MCHPCLVCMGSFSSSSSHINRGVENSLCKLDYHNKVLQNFVQLSIKFLSLSCFSKKLLKNPRRLASPSSTSSFITHFTKLLLEATLASSPHFKLMTPWTFSLEPNVLPLLPPSRSSPSYNFRSKLQGSKRTLRGFYQISLNLCSKIGFYVDITSQ